MKLRQRVIWVGMGLMAFANGLVAQDFESNDSSGSAPSAASEMQSYMIREGDTLWDVCKIVLDNPWYWPKLWSLNQYVLNPNIIFPGNQLTFLPGTATSFPRMEVLDSEEQSASVPSEEGLEWPQERVLEPEPKAASKAPAVTSIGGSDFIIERSVSFKTGGIEMKLRPISFITTKDIETIGKVIHSGEPKMELVFGDKVYLDFFKKRPVKVGDRFHVIQRVKTVFDPNQENKKIGVMVKKTAELTVNYVSKHSSWRKRVVEATISDGDDSVIRGDEIIPAGPELVTLVPHYTDREIAGKIVEAEAEQFLIGNNDYVYLDIGKMQGLVPGLQLYVVRTGDGLEPDESKELPDVPVGRLMVVEAHQKTATAYVMTLDRPLTVGDRVTSRVE